MPLNVQKGNMYGFVSHTWNTVKGKCSHDCHYCYMKRFPQKELRFDEKELKTDLGHGNFIFVGSSCDMFAADVPDKYILQTLDHCKNFNNTYLFQSKVPGRFQNFFTRFPRKTTLCTTIETNRQDLLDKYSGGDTFLDRVSAIKSLNLYFPTMITIEPIMDFDFAEFFEAIKAVHPFQLNIGSDSGNNNLPEPSREKILQLIEKTQYCTDVFQKKTLNRLL